MEAVLTYFKPDTGKYYSEGKMPITDAEKIDLGAVWDRVKNLNANGGLPGLIESSTGWLILVNVPGHQHEHPKMILPDAAPDQATVLRGAPLDELQQVLSEGADHVEIAAGHLIGSGAAVTGLAAKKRAQAAKAVAKAMQNASAVYIQAR